MTLAGCLVHSKIAHPTPSIRVLVVTVSRLFLFATAAVSVASAFRNNSIVLHPKKTKTTTTMAASDSSSGDGDRCGIDYPALVVFDLDACFWDQEMYEMPALPSKTVTGPLGDSGETGVTGAYSGRHKISMHPGSMVALREKLAGDKYPGMKVCFASSADTPFAEKIGRATLKLLEVTPGTNVWDLVLNDWDGTDVNQIGRQPPLSRCVPACVQQRNGTPCV